MKMLKGYFDRNDDEWIVPVPDRKGKHLDLHKGKQHTARDKYTRGIHHFTVERVVWAQESNYPEKIIVLEELKWDDNRLQLRLGYYTTSKNGDWWWGQFAAMVSKSDFNEIVMLAKYKGML